MRQDRGQGEDRPGPAGEPGSRGEYGDGYEGPVQGPEWSGSSGMPPEARRAAPASGRRPDESDIFEWGDGYIGGRGYGGTSYDLDHGYAVRGGPSGPRPGARRSYRAFDRGAPPSSWGEPEPADEYGPARYGYGPYYDRLRRRRRSDAEIRQEVEDTLFYDTWVDADAITVMVADGVVTLSGVLPSFEELRYAVDDAWDVDGVRGVRSELDVDEGGMRGLGRAGVAASGRAPADEQDASGDADAHARDSEWRRHLHGHPDAVAASPTTEEQTGSAGATRPGRRGRALAAHSGEAGAPETRRGARAGRGRSRGAEGAAEPGRAGRRGRGRTSRGMEAAPVDDAEPEA